MKKPGETDPLPGDLFIIGLFLISLVSLCKKRIMRKNAIVIGASSGIGKSLAELLGLRGYSVGLAARRLNLLEEVRKEISTPCFVRRMDLSDASGTMTAMDELIHEMEGVDLVVVSSGTGHLNPDLIWDLEKETIDVNVSGFAAAANIAMNHFIKQGSGHLVGISSIAAIRGGKEAPAYNASKAFVSNYLEGLRLKATNLGLPITVTDIQPGFVDTDMAKAENTFWMASPEKAALQIFRAIRKKKDHAYVTRRWRLIAWLFKGMPGVLYKRF